MSGDSPWLLLFVAVSVLLALGFFRGVRKNRRLAREACEALAGSLAAKRREFTNIGGVLGYHATIVPGDERLVRSVNATLTLLPRHSWLYYPFARLAGRDDRLSIFFNLRIPAGGALPEAHLVDAVYVRKSGLRLTNEDVLKGEKRQWKGREFRMRWSDEKTRAGVGRLMRRLESPDGLVHAALVPDRSRAYLLMKPDHRLIRKVVPVFRQWAGEMSEGVG